eukprot:jgi/Picsp_1/2197/NSC_05661-R1_hypothetical protein COCSUDRAFT_61123 [Coccomyxa subellipsoidea C-169]
MDIEAKFVQSAVGSPNPAKTSGATVKVDVPFYAKSRHIHFHIYSIKYFLIIVREMATKRTMLAAALIVGAALFLRPAGAFQYKAVEVGQYLQALYNAFSVNITFCPDPSEMSSSIKQLAADCFQHEDSEWYTSFNYGANCMREEARAAKEGFTEIAEGISNGQLPSGPKGELLLEMLNLLIENEDYELSPEYWENFAAEDDAVMSSLADISQEIISNSTAYTEAIIQECQVRDINDEIEIEDDDQSKGLGDSDTASESPPSSASLPFVSLEMLCIIWALVEIRAFFIVSSALIHQSDIMVLMVLDEAEEAARRERIVRGDRADGTPLQTDEKEERKDAIFTNNNNNLIDGMKDRDVKDESGGEVVGKHNEVVAAGKSREDDCGQDEAGAEGFKRNKTIEISGSANEDEGEEPAARATHAWDAAEEQSASEPVATVSLASDPIGSMDGRIRKSGISPVPGEKEAVDSSLEDANIAKEGQKKGKKTRHRRRLSLVSTQCGEDGHLQPAVLVSLNDVIDRHCLSPLVLKSPVLPFGGLMDDSFAYAMIQAEKEDSPEKEVEMEYPDCNDAASNGGSAGQSRLESTDYKEESGVIVSWNEDESHEKETSIPLHVYESDIARMEEDFEKRMKRAEECWEQRYEQMRTDYERSEKRIESLIRQSKVLEETSTSLGSQVMYLRSKLEKAEAALSEANKEMHVARMNGQTRMTTIENLTQQLQIVTVENCRLSKDKTGLEDNIRQLTSILQAMTALDTSRAIPDEHKNLLHTSEKIPVSTVSVACDEDVFQNGKLCPHREEQAPDKDLMPAEEQGQASCGVGGPTDRAPLSPNNNKNKSDITVKDILSPLHPFMDSGVAKQINNSASLKKGAEDLVTYVERKGTISELEKELLQLNVEKEKLDIELSRMPFNSAGKTLAQRQRRKYVESRLGEISKNTSHIKRQLRHLNAL